jgi:glycosyltransferase involved in cell wall biosynthesis
MKVSVIMPAYNARSTLADAIASLEAQRFEDYELIIVDDGSTDGTAEAARELAPEAVVLHQANGGPARARNTAISHARAPLLAFLDADDHWCPGLLPALFTYAERFPSAGLVSGRLDGPHRFDPHADENTPPRDRFCDIFHHGYQMPTSSVMARRSAVIEAGGFDERREIYVEDWDLWLRIAARHPIGHVPQAMVRHVPGLMSSAAHKTYRGQLLTIEKTRPLCAEVCPRHRRDPDDCLERRRHRSHHVYGCSVLRAGDTATARQIFRLALNERPLALRSRLNHAASFLSAGVVGKLFAVRDLVSRIIS